MLAAPFKQTGVGGGGGQQAVVFNNLKIGTSLFQTQLMEKLFEIAFNCKIELFCWMCELPLSEKNFT
jgi:hypothetical protein